MGEGSRPVLAFAAVRCAHTGLTRALAREPVTPLPAMNTADYLFPRDLEVTPGRLRRLLLIGSCLSESYAQEFKKLSPETEIEHILFGNAMALPEKSPEDLAGLDLQYIQIPLRHVLTDGAIRAGSNDWLAIGRANLDFFLHHALAYAKVRPLLSVVANFVVPQGRLAPSLADLDSELDFAHVVRELNAHLARAVRQHPNTYVADVDAIANSLGKKYFLDDTINFFSHGVVAGHDDFLASEAEFSGSAPNRLVGHEAEVRPWESRTAEFYEAALRQAVAIHRTVTQVDSVKLVVFDLDNTLWRGLIGEHYEPGQAWPQMHSWPLGVWDAVNQLRRRGILVSLCSKNDEATVRQKWKQAVPLPFIEFDDFLVPKINWRPKAENIATMLAELSLTPKNVVFVDDNPVERESVKAAFPEIRTLGADPFAVKRILTWAPETQVARLSAESQGREASLMGKIQRDAAQATLSREEFLARLQTEVTLFEVRDTQAPEFFRVQELVNKTNQFNTTATRRQAEDYAHHWSQGGRVFAFSVKDRFSDYGLVGVLFTLGSYVTQFVMSCRTLGMEIELAVLDEVAEQLATALPGAPVLGIVIKSAKNTPSQGVFLAAGFSATAHPQFFVRAAPPAARHAPHVQVNWAR